MKYRQWKGSALNLRQQMMMMCRLFSPLQDEGRRDGRSIALPDTQVTYAHMIRQESSHSTFPLNQLAIPQTDDQVPSQGCDEVLPDPPRRKSTGVVHRLESCHLGAEVDTSGRTGSLPSIPCATNSSPNEQCPWFAEPNHCTTSPSHFQSLADSNTWWDHSMPTMQPRPFPTIPWRPLPVKVTDSQKRKHEDELNEESSRFSPSRQSVQMSPRTNTLPTRTPSGYPLYHMNPNQFDMYGFPDQNQSAPVNWSNYGWNMYENQSPAQFQAQPLCETMSMDLPLPDCMVPDSLPRQQPLVVSRYEPPERRERWQHPVEQMTPPPRQSQRSTTSLMGPQEFPNSQHHYSQRLSSPRMPVRPRPRSSIPSSTPMALDVINAPRAPIPVAAQPQRPSENPVRVLTSPVQLRARCRSPPSTDILRRPSLYSVPAWPAAPPPTPSQPHAAYPAASTSTLGVRAIGSSQSAANPIRSLSPMVTRTPESARQPPALSHLPARIPAPAPSQSERSTFQIPEARMGRKHSPNLYVVSLCPVYFHTDIACSRIVDIAETCQEMFPFEAVAERHDVAIQKVFDTFSAIIQLPLLRNADDRRRHGSLGKRRTKEYRDARRAMQKAQEDERKAEMKAMRARVDNAAKRKDPSRNPGLLKSALLNNARDVQGSR